MKIGTTLGKLSMVAGGLIVASAAATAAAENA